VTTDRLRLWITATPDGYARVKELVVWPASVRQLPPLAAAAETPGGKYPADLSDQSGFNLGKPKRFTAPTLPDGTAFEVRPASASGGGAALFSGKITGHVGDLLGLRSGWRRPRVLSSSRARTRRCRFASANGGSNA